MNYEQYDDVALLHFDDGKVNVVGHDFIAAMNRGLDRAEQDAKAVVITGRPGRFSAGFDLAEFKKGPETAEALVVAGAHMLLRMFSHPQPIVAACTGHAIAAGAAMLLASDTRLGVPGDFKIGLNETAIGMNLPVFLLELASARLSREYLTASVVQGQLFPPEQAREAGFLDQVVQEQDLLQSSLDRAAQLALLPAGPYATNKRAIRARYISSIQESLA